MHHIIERLGDQLPRGNAEVERSARIETRVGLNSIFHSMASNLPAKRIAPKHKATKMTGYGDIMLLHVVFPEFEMALC
jgi:hypothetical protein